MITIDWYKTDHFSERSSTVKYIVLHGTEGPLNAALDWWTQPFSVNKYSSSAHSLISMHGILYNCVRLEYAAHHIGDSMFPEITNGNSIGIEFEYPKYPISPPWPMQQLQTGIEYIQSLMKLYSVPLENVKLHKDLNKDRIDPRNWPLEFIRICLEGPSVETIITESQRRVIPQNQDAAFYKLGRELCLEPISTEFDIGRLRFQVWYDPETYDQKTFYCPIGYWDKILIINN